MRVKIHPNNITEQYYCYPDAHNFQVQKKKPYSPIVIFFIAKNSKVFRISFLRTEQCIEIKFLANQRPRKIFWSLWLADVSADTIGL